MDSARWTILLVIATFGPPSVAAQSRATTADLVGTVYDQSRAVLPGATVTATNTETNQSRETVAEANGRFVIPALPPGVYRVKAELAGFAPHTEEDVVLQLGTELELQLTLNLPTFEQQVAVAASPRIIDRTQTAVASVVTQQQIDNLPINGRNFISFSRHHAGRDARPHAAAGRVGDVRPDVRGPARAVEQHHGRRPRQQRPRRRQRARDVQPGGGPRVPGAHQLLLRGVRQGLRRRRQHRDQERHEQLERQRLRVLPRRGAERQGATSSASTRPATPIDREKAPYSQKQFGGTLGGPIQKRTRRSSSGRSSGSTSTPTTSSPSTTRRRLRSSGSRSARRRRPPRAPVSRSRPGNVPYDGRVEPVPGQDRSSARAEPAAWRSATTTPTRSTRTSSRAAA